MVGHWQRNLTWNLDLRVIRIAGSHLVMHLAILVICEEAELCGKAFLMCCSLQPHQHHAAILLFHNFKLCNMKAVIAHHPIIQMEMDELSAKGAI